ncbi:DNA recombination protein RmuC [hydrothermal vent metagenome]|uniref:DNA recombination protein RmuC n=1 Tax=hydrothermal vent metagenome TaxID=652676 RepID=A0A3B0Z616_9ZZZZ
MDQTLALQLSIAAFLITTLGWLAAVLRSSSKASKLRETIAGLEATLLAERHANSEQLSTLDRSKEEFSLIFNSLATKTLKQQSYDFLKLAQQSLNRHHTHAQHELTKKEKSIESLLKPIEQALQKTEQQIHLMEKERKEAYGSISQHLTGMAQTQQQLHGETRNLVQALRRPEVRGQWGELTLQRLAELSGMVEHCDFYSQEQITGDNGQIFRPDMIIRLPNRREIIIDVKTPLDAYLSAIDADTDEKKQQYLVKHAHNVRQRIRELGSKAYWKQFKNTPDFVVLFIPGDHFLSAALDIESNLLEDAMLQKVMLATPTSLVALLRAVAYGWQQEALTENAEKIQSLGTDLYKRLAIFSSHFAKVGKQLNATTEHYNRAVGSFDKQLVPGAKKFKELGINSKQPVESINPIEINANEIKNNS